ncbi:MAG: recombinase family protein [Caulobacterales bacterium]|uniref:recombinase family protein n=1 Tax=Glycocaulis sp. TaxID=1969725 RepID=UPI003FA14325
MTTAIYARYSTDRQTESSIEDQVRRAERLASSLSLGPCVTYSDAALSGASMAGRTGLTALLDAVAGGRVSAVIVESLDRLSRDQADLALIWRRLRTRGVRLITVSEGEIGDDPAGLMQVGLRGIIGAMYLKDLADKTRRGLEGVVADGRHAGPPPYGYELAPAPATPGTLRIREDEAAIVRRICHDYSSGLSPRAIAVALNAEGVPAPRGTPWRNTTIFGQPQRGNGILWNPLYRGTRIWNRNRKVKDPETGKARMVANPPDAWISQPAPDLAILDAGLAARVDARRTASAGTRPEKARRPKRPLSGMLRCGSCGGNLVIAGGAPQRYGCATHKETGQCSGIGTVRADGIEARVLAALKHRLLSPEAIRLAVDTYREERARLAAESHADRSRVETRIAQLKRREARLLEAYMDGSGPSSMLAPLKDMEAERIALEAELANLDALSAVTTLHPHAAGAFARIITELETSLASDPAGAGLPAAQLAHAISAVRQLISCITVSRNEKSGEADLLVEGDLAALLSLSEGSQITVGAGAGFEPATFRL